MADSYPLNILDHSLLIILSTSVIVFQLTLNHKDFSGQNYAVVIKILNALSGFCEMIYDHFHSLAI